MSAARVGEHSAVEWKLVKRRPCAAMRSSAGVGTTPPNVPGAPKPTSSVMMSNTLGAHFGGTTRGAHQGSDAEAFSSIAPPNAAGGGGICLPLMVVVAPGDPSVPVTSCASAAVTASALTLNVHRSKRLIFISHAPGSFGAAESQMARRGIDGLGV